MGIPREEIKKEVSNNETSSVEKNDEKEIRSSTNNDGLVKGKRDEKKPGWPKIVRRTKWGAKRAKTQEILLVPMDVVLLTFYTNTETCYSEEECIVVVKNLQLKHKLEHKYSDIAYNFLIGGDGTIYKGRGWTRNAHRPKDPYFKFSEQCHEVALIGDFRTTDPPEAMMIAFHDLVNFGVRKKFIRPRHHIVERRHEKDMNPVIHAVSP